MSMYWFRFYSEAISDKKLRRVARLTGQNLASVLGIWAIMLSIASESPERGKLYISEDTPATADDIADFAGCNVTETLQQLHDIGLVTTVDGVICVVAWEKRQYESDNSTPRVKRHRERQKEAENTPDVTDMKRYNGVTVTPPDNRVQITDNRESESEPPPPHTVHARASVTRTVGVKPNSKLSPAVNAFAQVTGKFPPRGIHHLIDAAFEARDDPDLLQRCYETWLARGYRPENIAWLQEWYTAGAIPSQTSGNGRSKPSETPAADY